MTVSAFVQQPDSKLLASGFPDNDSPSSTLVARFLPNGEFDSTFAVGGTYTDPSPTGVFPFGMVVQPDGNLIVAGKALLNGAPQFALLRFDVNGNLDLSFGNAGKVVLQMDERNASEATAVALDSHQRIIVVGLLASEAQFSPSLPVSMSRIGVARFNTDGSPDLFFGPHGATAFWSGFGSIGTAVIILSGDKILVGGAVGGAAQYNVGVWVIRQSGALFRLQGGDGTVPLLIREEHAIEYYDNVFGHYFISATPYEIAYLDTFYSQAWVRTGRSFRVWTEAAPGLQQVCRFFSDQSFAPKSSHFYTPYPNECAALQAGTVWKFEGYVFELQLPAGMPGQGTCPEGTAPLYRLYNNGQGGAPNHRYTDDLTVFNQMLAQGWIFEGEAQTKVFACIPAQ